MLVLSRKREDEVIVGEGPDAVIVKVLRIDGGRVILGVQAPDGVKVRRREIADAA